MYVSLIYIICIFWVCMGHVKNVKKIGLYASTSMAHI